MALLLLVFLFLHATVVKAAAAPESPAAAAADPEAIEHWRRTFASERRGRERANNHSEFSTFDHHFR
jgi:hypothetical protein